jgi:hypothetical protein
MEMSVETAYGRSIETLIDWLHTEVNMSKTRVFFRTYAPVHFRFLSLSLSLYFLKFLHGYSFFFMNISKYIQKLLFLEYFNCQIFPECLFVYMYSFDS